MASEVCVEGSWLLEVVKNVDHSTGQHVQPEAFIEQKTSGPPHKVIVCMQQIIYTTAKSTLSKLWCQPGKSSFGTFRYPRPKVVGHSCHQRKIKEIKKGFIQTEAGGFLCHVGVM